MSAPSLSARAARSKSCPSAEAIAWRNACASAAGSPAPRAPPAAFNNRASGPAAKPPEATLPLKRSSAMRAPGPSLAVIQFVLMEVQRHESAQRGQRRLRVGAGGAKMQNRALGRLHGHDLDYALGVDPGAVLRRREFDL